MTPTKSFLALAVLLTIVGYAHAEYRIVLIQIERGEAKDAKTSVTIHSDDKQDRTSGASVDKAVGVIGKMTGWGSSVGVHVMYKGYIPSTDVKKLLVAILDNAWLDLTSYSHEAPDHVKRYFLGKAADARDAR